MHPLMLKELIDACHQRIMEGDHPTIQAFSVEQLEDAVAELDKRAEAAEAALAEARKDAERYRWLRDIGDRTFLALGRYADMGCPDVDTYIDTAIAASAKEAG